MISGYVWTLPAVTIVGWILSWWGTRRIRWCLLSAATVISVSCLVIGDRDKGPQISPGTIGCSPALNCMDWRGIYWLEAGLIGFVCRHPPPHRPRPPAPPTSLRVLDGGVQAERVPLGRHGVPVRLTGAEHALLPRRTDGRRWCKEDGGQGVTSGWCPHFGEFAAAGGDEEGGFGGSVRCWVPPGPVQACTPEVSWTQALAVEGLGAATIAVNVSVS